MLVLVGNDNLKIELFTHDTCVSKQEELLSIWCVSGPDYVERLEKCSCPHTAVPMH